MQIMFKASSALCAMTAAVIALSPLVAPAARAADAIRLAVTDIDGLEALQKEMGPFKEAFEKASGLKVEFFPVSGRTIAVEAMAADQVDFVLTGPAEYVVFNARLKAQPVVRWNRPDYYSNVLVLENGPHKNLVSLKGKKISFGEIGSTSQHLSPSTILAASGLVYGKDYEPVFLKRNVAVESMIKGDIAAMGVNRTHIEQITKKFPDQKFLVLAKGDALPSDVLLASPKVPAQVVSKVRDTFASHGEKILAAVTSVEANDKYVGGSFDAKVTDADYNDVRKMYRNVGVDEFTKFIE